MKDYQIPGITDEMIAEAFANANALNNASDTMNRCLRDAETLFVELGIGLPVKVQIGEYAWLKFGRFGTANTWRLLVVRSDLGSSTTPVTDVSRDLKIAAAGNLGNLLAALNQAALDRIEELNR
jgi:hypothetical protein